MLKYERLVKSKNAEIKSLNTKIQEFFYLSQKIENMEREIEIKNDEIAKMEESIKHEKTINLNSHRQVIFRERGVICS